MLYALLWIVHIVVCLFLIVVVLLQSGQAADLAGAFGGMGSQTAFGPRGSATLLSKATTASFIIFMLTSLALSIMATRSAGLGTSVLQTAPASGAPSKSTQVPVPVQVPGTPPAQSPANGTTMPLNLPPRPTTQSTPQSPAPAKSAPAPAPAGEKK
ncbi:MAG: preprotein translocase subunit SecG [Acidobacteriota bacterium]|nr:preprotein translocase subunit SecG [Acidobacteriota bacterium]